MPALLIRHRVTNVAAWRTSFDEQEPVRRAHGCLGGRILRNAAAPDEIVVLLEWDNVDRAWLFAQSDDMREQLRRAEITDRPDLWCLDEPNPPDRYD